MHHYSIAVAGVLLSTTLALAQPANPKLLPPLGAQPPAQPPVMLDPANNPLDAHLLRWEKEMKSVEKLLIQCKRTEKRKSLGFTDEFTGEAKFMKLPPVGATGQAENLAILHMTKTGKPEVYERFVCTGSHVYQFMPQQKEIRVYQLPPAKQGQVADDSFLSFLFGMKAEEAKRRYDLKLAKQDQHYVYVEILPRFPQDKAEFQRARLVLSRDTFLPRQLWFEEANGDEIMWDLPKVQPGAQLDRKEFAPPQAPKDWRLIQPQRTGPTDVPPRIIREKQ